MGGLSLNTLKPATIKLLCSYGGRILPRHPDGKLRYHGGQTRVLSVHSSISFAELLVKLGELCGTSVSLRCQLPTEDLDALVSITSDEDLVNLVEEYDRTASPQSALKIRAFLSPPRSVKKISPPPSIAAAFPNPDAASPKSILSVASFSRFPNPCVHQIPKPVVYHQIHHPLSYEKSGAAKVRPYHAHPGNHSRIYFIHNRYHWQ